MKKEKFLTVFAVFDEHTQEILSTWQKSIFAQGLVGTQTMQIPFHITLGSFPVEQEQELRRRIEQVCEKEKSFFINLFTVNTFADKVLFVQPQVNQELWNLHEQFNCNYADGFDYHPHTTIFCGTEAEVSCAKAILKESFHPLKAKITEIHLGEFFPTRMIKTSKLQA